jgi:hypothetical protein
MSSIKAGPAIPVRQSTDNPRGGPAIPVYGYTAAPGDRPAAGGAALPVKVLSASDLRANGGAFDLVGDPQAIPVYDAPGGSVVQGGAPIPVYPVNNWPGNIAPTLVSAEVGNVDTTTIAVTFDQAVTAANYKTGVTIKNGGATQTISTGTRQTNHRIVYYVITLVVAPGDVVTIRIDATNVITSESGGVALADTGTRSVTNHVGGYVQALQFNDARNSQYLSLMR